jgi:hypothetical protein
MTQTRQTSLTEAIKDSCECAVFLACYPFCDECSVSGPSMHIRENSHHTPLTALEPVPDGVLQWQGSNRRQPVDPPLHAT